MLLHKPVLGDRHLAPTPGAEPSEPGYQLDALRCVLAVAFLVLLFIASFIAWRAGWDQGSTSLLNMADVVFGGIVGIFFGERLAIADVRKK